MGVCKTGIRKGKTSYRKEKNGDRDKEGGSHDGNMRWKIVKEV